MSKQNANDVLIVLALAAAMGMLVSKKLSLRPANGPPMANPPNWVSADGRPFRCDSEALRHDPPSRCTPLSNEEAKRIVVVPAP